MKPVINAFTVYEFDDDLERYTAVALSPLQRAFIQSESAIAAERILGLAFEPDKPMKFLQEEAGLKGQRAAYEFLLEMDRTAQAYFSQARQEAKDVNSNGPSEDPVALDSFFTKS